MGPELENPEADTYSSEGQGPPTDLPQPFQGSSESQRWQCQLESSVLVSTVHMGGLRSSRPSSQHWVSPATEVPSQE